MSNVRQEVADNVRRLRHHACLALWCGNNELEPNLLADEWDSEHMGWDDYKKLFDVLIPETIKQYDPDTDYWPCSPHVPHDRKHFADDRWGDAHLWQVWHGKLLFEWYRTSKHRFVSEFGFQSFPEPKTVAGYTLPEDRNITSYVMEHHQRSPIGNTTIMTYMLEWFRLPSDFSNTLWLSQILQGIGMKYAMEHWRRNMPRTMGALYWQLNDCWPVASWASIDYHHRWKALQYLAKRFYAPLLVSAVEDAGSGTIEVWVTSDRMESVTGTVKYTVTRVDGDIVREGSVEIDIPPLKSRRATVLALRKELEEYGGRDLMVWLELVVDGEVVSSDTAFFSRPKHLELAEPGIGISLEERDGEFTARLKAKKPALWAWLELEGSEARFSDNFFHLRPGREVRVAVTTADAMDLAEIKQRLSVRSLRDTYC
jgi:beta-mannosidase